MEKNVIYTMEQFEEMYDNAVIKVIDVLNKKFHDGRKEKNDDSMGELLWSLHNILAFQELKKELFKNEESE